jgi:hypothetical protein
MSSSTSVESAADRALVALILRAFPLHAPPPLRATPSAAWDILLARARWHGLAPLLCAALDAQPRDDIPQDIAETLTELYRRSALAGAAKYHELAILLNLARADKLDLLLLKGAALAQWLYPAPALRPFGDVDVLVHQSDVPRLRALLEARAYRASDELADGFRDAYYSEMAFTQTAPPHLALDAHWHLFVPVYFRTRMDVQWFWAHTQSFPLGGASVLIFNPTAQLVHLSIHASLNHQNAPRLLWLYDLALLLKQHGTEIDWDAALTFARASHVTRSMYEILIQVEQWWDVCAPPSFLASLSATRIGVNERIAFALMAANRNEARALSDALATPGAVNKLRYAARHLFPAPAYMTQHYRIPHPALLPLYYARRIVESSWKFARSLVSSVAHR